MDRKIRVGAVSYLNTKPLLYGIERSSILQSIHLTIDYPARIADMLLNDEIDVGLVPISIIPQMKDYHINTNYCIGSNGPVASVCLFSENPIESIDKVMMDYQSRTSVELAKILLKEYWKVQPELVDTGPDFMNQIKGNVAGVIIGDRALQQRRISPYSYDLGEAWKNLTGLPFVFAAWISCKKLDDVFVQRFDRANSIGLIHLDEVVSEIKFTDYDLITYYTKNISYHFSNEKKKGMELFIQKLREQH